jgi:Integrase core domain
MRAEFFRAADGQYATLAQLQAALDAWVADYNTARPHQSCGGRPPAERFQLAGTGPPSRPARCPPRVRRERSGLPGVSRWVSSMESRGDPADPRG